MNKPICIGDCPEPLTDIDRLKLPITFLDELEFQKLQLMSIEQSYLWSIIDSKRDTIFISDEKDKITSYLIPAVKRVLVHRGDNNNNNNSNDGKKNKSILDFFSEDFIKKVDREVKNSSIIEVDEGVYVEQQLLNENEIKKREVHSNLGDNKGPVAVVVLNKPIPSEITYKVIKDLLNSVGISFYANSLYGSGVNGGIGNSGNEITNTTSQTSTNKQYYGHEEIIISTINQLAKLEKTNHLSLSRTNLIIFDSIDTILSDIQNDHVQRDNINILFKKISNQLNKSQIVYTASNYTMDIYNYTWLMKDNVVLSFKEISQNLKKLASSKNFPLPQINTKSNIQYSFEEDSVSMKLSDLDFNSDGNTRIFIRNIPYEANPDHLYQLLLRYGNANRFVGNLIKSRGIAFVSYNDIKNAVKAKEALNGYEYLSKPLYVHYASSEFANKVFDINTGNSKYSFYVNQNKDLKLIELVTKLVSRKEKLVIYLKKYSSHLINLLTSKGFTFVETHESKNQLQITPFTSGNVLILVITDIVSKGLRLKKHYSNLIHYDFPSNFSDFKDRTSNFDRGNVYLLLNEEEDHIDLVKSYIHQIYQKTKKDQDEDESEDEHEKENEDNVTLDTKEPPTMTYINKAENVPYQHEIIHMSRAYRFASLSKIIDILLFHKSQKTILFMSNSINFKIIQQLNENNIKPLVFDAKGKIPSLIDFKAGDNNLIVTLDKIASSWKLEEVRVVIHFGPPMAMSELLRRHKHLSTKTTPIIYNFYENNINITKEFFNSIGVNINFNGILLNQNTINSNTNNNNFNNSLPSINNTSNSNTNNNSVNNSLPSINTSNVSVSSVGKKEPLLSYSAAAATVVEQVNYSNFIQEAIHNDIIFRFTSLSNLISILKGNTENRTILFVNKINYSFNNILAKEGIKFIVSEPNGRSPSLEYFKNGSVPLIITIDKVTTSWKIPNIKCIIHCEFPESLSDINRRHQHLSLPSPIIYSFSDSPYIEFNVIKLFFNSISIGVIKDGNNMKFITPTPKNNNINSNSNGDSNTKNTSNISNPPIEPINTQVQNDINNFSPISPSLCGLSDLRSSTSSIKSGFDSIDLKGHKTKCLIHNLSLKLFCKQCNTLICIKCHLKGDHISHDTEYYKDYFNMVLQTKDTIGQLNNHMDTVVNERECITNQFNSQVTDKYQSQLDDISKIFRELHDSLHFKEVEIKRELHSYFNDNQEQYTKYLSEYDYNINQLSDTISKLNNIESSQSSLSSNDIINFIKLSINNDIFNNNEKKRTNITYST